MGMSVRFHVFPFMVDKIPLDSSLSLWESNCFVPLSHLKTFHQPGRYLPGTTGALHSRLLWRVQEDTSGQSQVSDCILKASLLLSICTTKHLLVAFVKLIWYWYVWSVLGVGIYACHILVTICRLSSCVDLFAHAQDSCDMLWLQYLIHLQASSLGLLTRKIHSHSHY